MKKCSPMQYSDQVVCLSCGAAWDMNDPFPPECPLVPEKKSIISRFLSWFKK